MNPRALEIGIPTVVAGIGIASLAWWVSSYSRAPQVPDRPLVADIAQQQAAELATQTQTPETRPAEIVPKATVSAQPAAAVSNWPGAWPMFRGPNLDNVCADSPKLLDQWPPEGPPKVYAVALGEGYAGPAILQGRFFVLDYDRDNRADVLRCFNLTTGQEIWRNAYPVIVKRNHGMSRTVPATDGQVVVSLGPKCHVLAADFQTGKTLWFKDLVKEFGTIVPEWYAGQCPLIDQGRVILAPGGKALMIAADLATGKGIWRAPNPRNWNMTHSSILPVEIGGTRMYVYCGSGGVAGVSASDGKILWEFPDWVINTATVPTPVNVGGGKLFLAGGYNAGAIMLQVAKSGSVWQARQVFRLKSTEFGSDQQTPIFYQNHIYGVVPGGQMVCLDLNGKRVWASGSKRRFGLGAYALADSKIFALDDQGRLSMMKADSKGYQELGSAKVLEGPDAWGPIAFAGGLMLIRDQNQLLCLNLNKS